MDGLVLLLGFLAGLFVYCLIVYLNSEPKPKEPKSVMDSATWKQYKELITDYNETKTENRHKLKVLEEAWFESHPCEYRKPGLCEGYNDHILYCYYPNPEGSSEYRTDMLSYCGKCKVRKEPKEEYNDQAS